MVKVENLSFDYCGKGQYVISDISFSIGEGEIFGFLGPSGAGKSTVRHLMTGLFAVPTIPLKELLEQVGLGNSAGKKAGNYSKGMKQRFVFARALLNKPHYLFLDEPTSGLDPAAAARICDIIMEQKKRGAVIFLTTHNVELADKLCDRVAFLDGGTDTF